MQDRNNKYKQNADSTGFVFKIEDINPTFLLAIVCMKKANDPQRIQVTTQCRKICANENEKGVPSELPYTFTSTKKRINSSKKMKKDAIPKAR